MLSSFITPKHAISGRSKPHGCVPPLVNDGNGCLHPLEQATLAKQQAASRHTWERPSGQGPRGREKKNFNDLEASDWPTTQLPQGKKNLCCVRAFPTRCGGCLKIAPREFSAKQSANPTCLTSSSLPPPPPHQLTF